MERGASNTKLTEVLKLAIKESGMQKAYLARELGVSRQYINNVLSGRTGLSEETWLSWLNVLGVEPVISLKRIERQEAE